MDKIVSNAASTGAEKLYDLVQQILAIIIGILGVAENPILSFVSVAVVTVGGYLVYLWVKNWINKKAIEAAEKDSQKDFQDQIDTRLPENKEANEKDEENRKKLDQLQ